MRVGPPVPDLPPDLVEAIARALADAIVTSIRRDEAAEHEEQEAHANREAEPTQARPRP